MPSRNQIPGFAWETSTVQKGDSGSVGPTGPTGPGGTGDIVTVPFTFSSGTMLLQQVFADDIIDAAWVTIETPFDGASASIQFGTSTVPGLIMATGNVTPSVVDQYANQQLNQFLFTDNLMLIVTSGGSTQGTGTLYYRYY